MIVNERSRKFNNKKSKNIKTIKPAENARWPFTNAFLFLFDAHLYDNSDSCGCFPTNTLHMGTHRCFSSCQFPVIIFIRTLTCSGE